MKKLVKDFNSFVNENYDVELEIDTEKDLKNCDCDCDCDCDEDGEVDTKEDLKEYGEKILKKAHGEDYNQEKADSFINDLLDKIEKDELSYSEAVGIIQNSLGE